MITNQPQNESFFPKLNVARKGNPLLDAACKKIEGKLKEYAKDRGIKPDELQLFDVCDADAELHPKLRLYINTIPQLKKQTDARYEKYKEEISSHIQRAIDAVVFLVTGIEGKSSPGESEGEIPTLLRHEHPVLIELFDLLPRQTTSNGRFQRGKKISEAGCFFYLACAETLKQCSASTLQEFLSEYRHLLVKSFKIVCLSAEDKIPILRTILHNLHKKLDIKRPSKRNRLPVEKWPSPLREEMQVLKDVVDGKLLEGLEEKLAHAEVDIKIHSSIRSATLSGIEDNVELLLFRYCQGRERLGLRDLLSTTITKYVEVNGQKKPVYYNPVLSPFREAERARADEFKRARFDSNAFNNTLTYLLTMAAYNGIFEYHGIIREAFKINLDVERVKQRKANKKAIIKRHVLDKWIEDNWSEYERILTQGLFKRNKELRLHFESDRNMRFILFYNKLTTLYVMGYRQRQLRDCKDGVNLISTETSIEFTYKEAQTKNGKELHFMADLENFEETHGHLILTQALFRKYAFPYIQDNLNLWQTGNEELDRKLDPRGQVFVYLTLNGNFSRFHPEDSRVFTGIFRNDCRRFVKHPDLRGEALFLLHAHYLRGASMDTQILDKGMKLEVASKYYGVSRQVIESKYKDRNAAQDASRDVMLQNAEMEELAERKKRNRAKRDEKSSSSIERELRQLLRESQEREKGYQESSSKKDERIAALELSLAQEHARQEKRLNEIVDAISRINTKQGNGHSRSKRATPSTRRPKRTKSSAKKDA